MTQPDFLSQPVPFDGPDFETLLADLSRHAAKIDQQGDWPEWQFSRLAEEGVLGWVIPVEYGGSGLDPEMVIFGYERLATACLTTTFNLTQRNGACQRIAGCDNDELKAELLPDLAAGRLFATVGVSHLTTSRQHLSQPAVQAEEGTDTFVLNGQIPWVTGAKPADYVVTGGTCGDGRQILIALPTHLDGVTIDDPVPLLALNGSLTGSIKLQDVVVERRFLLDGPVHQVMRQGQGGGTGSVATSSLAVGLIARSLAHLMRESDQRPELTEVIDPFVQEWSELRADLYATARGEGHTATPRLTTESVRQRANSLALRSTQALLAASKGAGFVAGHPAERGIREALFFLVWSCPQPIVTAALREFACLVD